MLSGRQIVEYGIVSPAEDAAIQPASVDLTLGGDGFISLRSHYLDRGRWKPFEYLLPLREEPQYKTRWHVLSPDDFALNSTAEEIYIPPEFVGRVEGKSTLARMGLIVHTTAGFIDPGFRGKITLELKNVGPCTLVLTPGMYICQLSVQRMERVDDVYKGKYQGAKGVEGAKLA